MRRQEESVHQPIRLHQPVAVQPELLALGFEEAPLTQRAKGFRETIPDFHSEFLAEVADVYVAELELEDQLPNHPLIFGWSQRTVDRELALAQLGQIRIEVVLILVVSPAHVRERRDPQ